MTSAATGLNAESNPADTTIETDVLIVGAGPTGLTLATALQRAGFAPLVADRLAASQNTSRAAVIHAHTLEALESIGVSQRLMQAGLRLDRFSVRDGDSLLARLHFKHLPSRFACLLMLTQDETERILADALARAGGQVNWNWVVEHLIEVEGGVEARIATPGGRRTVRAKYVVGADGMHSVVRQAAGIGFTGHSYEQSFILADVDMHWPQGRDEVMLFFSPPGPVVVAPLPGGRFRIVATLDNAPAELGAADVAAVLASRGPGTGAVRVDAVHWSSRFRLHHRVADHYLSGRYLLVGDAAHVHSPAGGQGMNTGLVDACVLAKLLSDVLSGARPASDLVLYETLRRPAAKQVLNLAGRLTGAAMLKGALPRVLRNFVFRLIGRLPALRRKLELNLSGISRRAAAEVPDIAG